MTTPTEEQVFRFGWTDDGPPGLWKDEPDKVVWIDEATGLDCMIRRNAHSLNLCGYVGVPPGHPWHGKGYDNEDLNDVEVHGGLTFAAPCPPEHDDRAICHVPGPGRPDNVWWFGFDAGHFMDYQPGLASTLENLALADPKGLPHGSAYRNVEYMKNECRILAEQLAEAAV